MTDAADLGLVPPSPAKTTAASLGLAPPQGPSVGERMLTGITDPLVGMGQMAAHMGVVTPTGGMPEFGGFVTLDPLAKTEDIDKAVRQREETYQARRKAAGQKGSDVARGIGELLTGIGLSAPMMAIGPEAGAGTLSRIGYGLLSGAGAGAITGAAEPVAKSGSFIPEKSGQIASGALFGGLLGGIAGGIESAVLHFLTPSEDRIAQQATDAVVRRLNQDAKSGGPTAEDALKIVAERQKSGVPMVLADVGGENTKALAGYVSRQPGESRSIARTALNERDKAAAQRLTQSVSQYVSDGGSAYETTQALLKARSQSARPLYQRAEALQGIWSPRLQQFLDDPEVRRGLARGYRLERLDALAENRPFDPTQIGIELDAEGNVKLLRVPNLRVLDMGKRGLDAMIADQRDTITGRLSALGRSLENVRKAYVGEIDGLDTSGVYRAARDAWAGPSASLDAVKFGRSIFNRNPEETAAELAQMSGSDKEFVRLGVADILRERIAKTGFGGNEARALIKNAWTRAQLRPIFKSDQEFDKFVDAVMAEHTMAETTSRLIRGSQTAERVAEDTSAETRAMASAAGLAHSIASGRPIAALRYVYQLRRDLGLKPNEKLNEAVAKLLFSANPRFFKPTPKPSSLPYSATTLGDIMGTMSGGLMGR